MNKRIIPLVIAISLIVAGTAIISNASVIKQQKTVLRNSDDGREIEVTTDKDQYALGEPVKIIITSVGENSIAGFAYLDIYYRNFNGYYNLIFWAGPGDIPDLYELAPGESYVYTWDQKDNNGNQADIGEFKIDFTFMACCGPIDSDNTNITIYNPSINDLPNPPAINGPTSGEREKTYTFDFTITDPDGDDLQSLEVDFGDTTTGVIVSNWHSGDTTQVSHKWKRTGSFQIKARVQDIREGWSEWSTFGISIPKNKMKIASIFERLQEFISYLFQ